MAIPIAAMPTLIRISTPSIPNRVYAGSGPRLRMSSPSSKTGSSHWVMRLSPSGSPRYIPRKTDGIASRISGTVMTGADSWILSQISFGPRKVPQKVRPISRNM